MRSAGFQIWFREIFLGLVWTLTPPFQPGPLLRPWELLSHPVATATGLPAPEEAGLSPAVLRVKCTPDAETWSLNENVKHLDVSCIDYIK